MKYLDIDYAYHTHTYRCGHAHGLDEDYIKEAINAGIKFIGFSDHSYYKNLDRQPFGKSFDDFYDYNDSIKALKEKYAGTAEIFLGGEYEYSDECLDFYKELKEKYGYDYLICGQHFRLKNNKRHYYFDKVDDYEAIEEYKTDVIKAIRSGLFLYIAHPDLFFNSITHVNEKIVKICREIVEEAVKYDVPLELNLGGMRYGNIVAQSKGCLPYPNKAFFEIAKEYNAKIVVGIDAHQPNDFHESDYRIIQWLTKNLNLNIIKDLRIK